MDLSAAPSASPHPSPLAPVEACGGSICSEHIKWITKLRSSSGRWLSELQGSWIPAENDYFEFTLELFLAGLLHGIEVGLPVRYFMSELLGCSAARIDHKLSEDKRALNLCCPQSPQRELSDVEHRALSMKLIRLEKIFLSRERTPRHERVRHGAAEDIHRFTRPHRSPPAVAEEAHGRLPPRPVLPHMMQHPPATGIQHPTTTDVHHPPGTSLQHPPAMVVQHPPATSVQHPPAMSIQHPPAQGVLHPPTTGVHHSPTTGVLHPPATGLQVPPAMGVQHLPAMNVQHHPAMGIPPTPPATSAQPPPATGVSHPPAKGIQPPLATSVQHSPATDVQRAPATSVQPPPTTGVQPPPVAGVQPPPVTGGLPGMEVQPDMGPQPGTTQQVGKSGQHSTGAQSAPATTVVQTSAGTSRPARTSTPQGKSAPSPAVVTAPSSVTTPVAQGTTAQTPGVAKTADAQGGAAAAGAAGAAPSTSTATVGVNSASASAVSGSVNATSGPSASTPSSEQGAFIGPEARGLDALTEPTTSFVDPSGRRHPYKEGTGLKHIPMQSPFPYRPPLPTPTPPVPASAAAPAPAAVAGAVLEGRLFGRKLLGVSKKASPVEAPPTQKRRKLDDRADGVNASSAGGSAGENGGGDPWAASTPDTPEDVAAMEYLKWELHGKFMAFPGEHYHNLLSHLASEIYHNRYPVEHGVDILQGVVRTAGPDAVRACQATLRKWNAPPKMTL